MTVISRPRRVRKQNFRTPIIRGKSRRSSDVIEEILNSLRPMLSRPLIIILIVALLMFIYNHGLTLDKGPLKVHCANKTSPFCVFLQHSPTKFLGMAAAVPFALDMPNDAKYPFLGAFVAGVWFLDAVPFLVYVLILFLAHTFFRVRSFQARALIVSIAFACYYFEAHILLSKK